MLEKQKTNEHTIQIVFPRCWKNRKQMNIHSKSYFQDAGKTENKSTYIPNRISKILEKQKTNQHTFQIVFSRCWKTINIDFKSYFQDAGKTEEKWTYIPNLISKLLEKNEHTFQIVFPRCWKNRNQMNIHSKSYFQVAGNQLT